MNAAVICADIGSVAQGRFGWFDGSGTQGVTPSSLAEHVAGLLNQGQPVALGFECPLFVPLVENEQSLTLARPGEGSRPWSAGAGCGVLTTGIVQVAWVLQHIRRQLEQPISAFTAWDSFVQSGSGLFLWEAFVSAGSKTVDHIGDARVAVQAFVAALPDPRDVNAIRCTSPVYSLLGATLLRTAWSNDISVLSQSCLVIKA